LGEAMAVQGMREDDLAVAKLFAPIPALRAGGDGEGATETAGAKAALVTAYRARSALAAERATLGSGVCGTSGGVAVGADERVGAGRATAEHARPAWR
jgi:hypothetical protein